jgi:hypothetical protein
MAVQQASTMAVDAILQAYLDRNVADVVDLMAPVSKKVYGAAKEVRVNQKGREKAVLGDVRATFQAGPSSMEYPAGVGYVRTRFKTIAVDQVETYEIDRATYEDYSAKREGTLVSIAEEMDLLMKSFAERREFFLAGDGSGKLGTVGTGSTDTIIVMDTVTNGTPAKAYGVSQLKPGVAYDVYNASDVLTDDDVFITEGGIDYTNNTVTMTAALVGAPTAGYYFVPANSWRQLPHGFAYLFAGGKTGYWEGTLVTNRQEYQTPYVNAGGNEVSNYYIERLLQKSAFRNGTGVNPTFKIFASPSVISIYKTPGWNMFRFAAKDSEYNTAFKNARYEDSVFEPFPKCDPDTLYGVDLSDVVHVVQTDIGPFKGADGMLFRQQQGTNQRGKGSFYMNYGCSDNLTIDHPNRHIVARNFDVSESATIYNFSSTT